MWTFVYRRVVPRSAVAFTLARDEHGYHGDVLYLAPVSDLARANISDTLWGGLTPFLGAKAPLGLASLIN